MLAVTGASNVTGEVWPLNELADLAHAHGAELFVDAAQLAPHRVIDMAATGIDHLALSGHKLYAPFGAGALVSRTPVIGRPLLQGGGAIKLVTVDDVIWADAPERYEAGSPNVIGAVALAAACDALDMARRRAPRAPARRASARGLATVAGLTPMSCGPAIPTGWASPASTSRATSDCALAEILSDEHAIGVRHGCFCAHPLLTRLLGVTDAEADACTRSSRPAATRSSPGRSGRASGSGRPPRTSTP